MRMIAYLLDGYEPMPRPTGSWTIRDIWIMPESTPTAITW